MLVVSYNPGYQNILKSLKPSTRQRFVALELGFPRPELELQDRGRRRAGSRPSGCARSSTSRPACGRSRRSDLEEAASTRLLVYAASLIRAGFDPATAVEHAMIEPLSDDADVKAGLRELVRASFG